MAQNTPNTRSELENRAFEAGKQFAGKSKLNKTIVVTVGMLVAAGAYLGGCPEQGDKVVQATKEVSTIAITKTTTVEGVTPTTVVDPSTTSVTTPVSPTV